MIQIYSKATRFEANHGWLVSDHHFSFADYYDPSNLQFGALRVFNDDWVEAQRGFGAHPHRDMEIVSIVLRGALQHADSTGRKEVIRVGEVQYMCAGTGIVHSEVNPSADEAVNFLQLWFLPKQKGLTPVYAQQAYPQEKLHSQWVQLLAADVSNQSNLEMEEHVIRVHQDVNLYLTNIAAGETRAYVADDSRRIYFYVIEGQVELNGMSLLGKRDAARIEAETELQVKASEDAFVLLIDMA